MSIAISLLLGAAIILFAWYIAIMEDDDEYEDDV